MVVSYATDLVIRVQRTKTVIDAGLHLQKDWIENMNGPNS